MIDCFYFFLFYKGLVSIVFGQLKNALSVTLVSDGAECIRIRKSFFIKMTPESLFDRLRREVISILFTYLIK
jgi:hypothetical protein